jgi:hypothetical protein
VSPWYLANAGPLRLVLEKARAEARDRWAKLTLPQRREITISDADGRPDPADRAGDKDVPAAVGRGGVARNMNTG